MSRTRRFFAFLVFPAFAISLSVCLNSGAARSPDPLSQQQTSHEVSFRNDVQPILTKAGCNSGACHGAAAGKNGLKLSLRGYDSEGDYLVLTRQAKGRRISLADPSESLILLKPTAAIPHGGGKRFDVESPEYQTIVDWIASAAPAPKPDDPRIQKIEITPPTSILKAGQKLQLKVLATFSDGKVQDVTRYVKYNAANADVAGVDDVGNVSVVGHGEAAITAWYLNRIFVATVTVPFQNEISPGFFASQLRRNFIDELVLEKLQSLNIKPSEMCSDAEFIRRSFLDTIGVLPTAEEAKAFVDDRNVVKRDRLIDSLLARPEFVDYWTHKFADLLLVNSEKLDRKSMWTYFQWIRTRVAADMPWDEFVHELVTAQGNVRENGAANFFILHQDPRELVETISQAFLGMSINCARCHNHPLEKWTNEQYYGMVNLVSRVRIKDSTTGLGQIVHLAQNGDVIQPISGKVVTPQPLDGKPVPDDALKDRREYLAEWLTDPANPYFSRAIANRIWANFLGVGLVEKVDDLRLTNPSSHEKLLSALASHLRENKYDLKALMRTILTSSTYQRSSLPIPENARDNRFYSRYYPKRMTAEVMLDAISQVTDVPTKFGGVTYDAPGLPATESAYPIGWRAMQLPDSKVASYFLKRFGRAERDITCECERTNETSVIHALHLSNGDAINEKLATRGSRVDSLLASGAKFDAIVHSIYLTSLGREPTVREKQKLEKSFAQVAEKDRRQWIEDLFWAILSTKEFMFNH